MTVTSIRTDVDDHAPYGQERDACAIYLSARKQGQSTFGTLKRGLGAVANMGHRTGFVNGEGDGAGVQTDIPRRLWARRLSQAGLRASLATSPGFWVGHLFMPYGVAFDDIRDAMDRYLDDAGLELLIEGPAAVRPEALGRMARRDPSTLWQIAGYSDSPDVERRLLDALTRMESDLPVHFASLSSHTVVYKVRGSVQALSRYYPDLQDRAYDTAMVLCHARYSTNTVSSCERAQPFALLGHNGEINTISRFRQEARQIDAVLPADGSDSQDIDRALHTLCAVYGLDLIEAIELIFPPVPHELELLPPTLRSAYRVMRQAYGPYAQGPAAIVARYGDVAVFSVDALGLRPLWYTETEKEYIFSSERGAVALESVVTDPRPFAPGEKMALLINRGQRIDVLTHDRIRQRVAGGGYPADVFDAAGAPPAPSRSSWSQGGWMSPTPARAPSHRGTSVAVAAVDMATRPAAGQGTAHQLTLINPRLSEMPWHAQPYEMSVAALAAVGWGREHAREIDSLASTGKDLIGSLGHDGPLAALSQNRVNLADFFKETVAVVTNPSIDRGREAEAFSTHVLVGTRPAVDGGPGPDDLLVSLEIPLLSGGHPALGEQTVAQEVARQLGTLSIEQLLAVFEGRAAWLTLGVNEGESVRAALDRLADEAIEAVRGGAGCLVLDDADTIRLGLGWLDPHLATAHIDEALRSAEGTPNLRRRAGLVVRSAGIRTLHDVALLLGFGADAINPYAMLAVALNAHKGQYVEDEDEQIAVQARLLGALRIGLEKVISTMGCHELRGYGRVSSSVGLAPSVARTFGTPNFFGSEGAGLTWDRLDAESTARAAELRGEAVRPRFANVDRFYPKFWKTVERYAMGEVEYEEVAAKFEELSSGVPVALRHILGVRNVDDSVDPADVDLSVDGYDLPVIISAMSFGSQGELSYRAYAEAASRLNIICVNGEGGELPDLMGVYKRNRGQQVASGRFGVNAEFLNSSAVIEIKIGQGAKPGEGGMLPGHKVTPQVASARSTTPFVPLLSPSNNHDLYSIEDLAQLIEELKSVNPYARVSVKCPVVPNIGLIAVGVAKAGADIITLTGYDGATGAARKHALQYVGLPTEIGVVQAHRALLDAGIRQKVELWCDGGMKTGADAMKMILLGANRVGFATMAMVSIGCTICRKCNEGTCHVGITTHIKSVDEADELGLPRFVPRVYGESVERLVRVFEGIGGEMRALTAQLGATRLQDLVGRADLLEQVAMHDYIDLSALRQPATVPSDQPVVPGVGRVLTRPRNNLTRLISELIVETIAEGERELTYQDEVMAFDRALGSHLAGELVRFPQIRERFDALHLRFGPSSTAGNGFSAWLVEGMDVLIEGGAQDGVAKGASGGRVAVMKGMNHNGLRVDGSVGKSFAYGAQRGVLIVQGDADSRACIRLSGADVVLGGEITRPVPVAGPDVGTSANLKGFACEYMTSGRVVILGDPGPYAFAGMTGGVVYQLLSPALGFDEAMLRSRLAKGAQVAIQPIEPDDVPQIHELLGHYIEALHQTSQPEVASRVSHLAAAAERLERFVKVVPELH